MTQSYIYPHETIKTRLGLPLSPLVSFPRRNQASWGQQPNVGLTGSTGWVGRHLARRLLSQNQNLCLVVPVRARNMDQAMERIRALWCPTVALSEQAFCEHWWDRTQVIPVDDLGLPWEDCGLKNGIRSLDVVIHTAADMSLALSLDGAWNANVTATQNAYRWGVESGAKRFDHISTLSVFIAGITPPGKVCEDDPLERAETLHGGYAASKWAAEAWLSSQKQLALAVHRLGLLSYSNTDGWAQEDGLYAASMAWKKWGCPDFVAAKVSQTVDWSPVDVVSVAVHETILQGRLGVFHWASRLSVPATVWTRLWSHQFGSVPGVWPVSDPLGKLARRALGRWSNPVRAKVLWWHDLFQSGDYQYDARHASEIYPQWGWTQVELEAALSKIA